MLMRGKKEEESGELGIFTHLDKALVIQDAKLFNDTPLKTDKCLTVLTKLLYMLYHGEAFTSKEATNVFFAVTKAFQSKDLNLRRLVYLIIKELSGTAQDVIMVISSLTQDMNILPQFKANALRALGTVVDSTLISGVERVFKQAISDRNANVAASALTTAIHFFGENREAVRRWLPEVQAGFQAGYGKTTAEYHALGLLYLIKQNDRMALSKLIQSVSPGSHHVLTSMFTLRMYNELLKGETMFIAELRPFLRMKGKSDIVALEAARVICSNPDVYPEEVVLAITTLQGFLGSGRALQRFAALRILSQFACSSSEGRKHVSVCNTEIESLVSDSNRNVATLAITTLLKTGNESSVDRLIEQITSFVSEISDEFRITVVEAVRSLGLKFPSKIESMLNFLGTVLREEGGLAFKTSVVNAACDLLAEVPSARDAALAHLCEFIEDCEHPELTAQILHLIGEEGPHTESPAKFVRYVYNRLILEGSLVRCAAIGALAKLAVGCPQLKKGIIPIIRRALDDSDDNVRDRAVISLKVLQEPSMYDYISNENAYDFTTLEAKLEEYINNSQQLSASSGFFDISEVPTVPNAKVFHQARLQQAHVSMDAVVPKAFALSETNEAASTDLGSGYRPTELPLQFQEFGPVYATSNAVGLTEAETEYVVHARKHIFANHIVLEFECRNTVSELLLTDVMVHARVQSNITFTPLFALPINRLPYDELASCFVAYAVDTATHPDATFECALKFTATEIDPTSGNPLGRGSEDEYTINNVELVIGDYLKNREVADFGSDWSNMDEEVVETMELPSMHKIEEAVQAVMGIITLKAYKASDRVDPSAATHTLLIAGKLQSEHDNGQFSLRARFALGSSGVAAEIAVRAKSNQVASFIQSAIC